MANEQKISKWWLWAFPALANLYLLLGLVLLWAGIVLDSMHVYAPWYDKVFDAFTRPAWVFCEWVLEPARCALGLTRRQFSSPFTIVFIWELMAFAGGLLCYKVGLLCHNVAGKPRRAPNGEGQQPRDRGEAREPEKGGAGGGTQKETGGNE